MALAQVERDYPDELRADMQRYYGLCLDDMGRTYTHKHAAALMCQLPQQSRVCVAINPDAEWDEVTQLLVSIDYSLRILVWQRSGRKSGKPKEPKWPSERAAAARRVRDVDRRLVDNVLGGDDTGRQL